MNTIQLDKLDRLYEAARVAVTHALNVKTGERVLIVSNPPQETFRIAAALHNAVYAAGGIPILMVQPIKTQLDFADDAVIQAIASVPDVFISMSAQKLGKDRFAISEAYTVEGKNYDHVFHYLMASKQLRAFWSPMATEDMFIRTVPVDYERMLKEVKLVKGVLDRAEQVHVTTPAGTDLTIGLRGRESMEDDGNLSFAGAGGNLPAGEAFISPELGSSQGVIVFDGSVSLHDGDRIVNEPVYVEVKDGFVSDISGGEEAQLLQQTIDYGEEKALLFEQQGRLAPGKGEEYKQNARSLGELGIGLNPAGTITGHMLEDEKAYETCHIAIGSNYDNDASALIHLDCLMRAPTIVAEFGDGTTSTILESGVLQKH
ncbi:MAG: aminopeptidase [Spirochaetota bacterium]